MTNNSTYGKNKKYYVRNCESHRQNIAKIARRVDLFVNPLRILPDFVISVFSLDKSDLASKA